MSNNYHNLFIETSDIKAMLEKATVVVDTNVLLMAYQWKDVTFEKILEILTDLSNQDRLKIPSHVVREFAKNRPEKIKNWINELHQFISNIPSVKNNGKSLDKIIPAIEVLESQYEPIVEIESKFEQAITQLKDIRKEYIEALNGLKSNLGECLDSDPILKKYNNIIRKSFFDPEETKSEAELHEEWNKRLATNIPPGYMDKGKKDNKYGDIIVWNQICKLQSDVIYITADNKPDWVYTSSNEEVIGARRELVEEFYNLSGGKTFKILTPLQFVNLYASYNVESDIQEDLKNTKRHLDDFYYNMQDVSDLTLNIKDSEEMNKNKTDILEGNYRNLIKSLMYQNYDIEDVHLFIELSNEIEANIKRAKKLNLFEMQYYSTEWEEEYNELSQLMLRDLEYNGIIDLKSYLNKLGVLNEKIGIFIRRAEEIGS
ncbi:TPA: PIN-like domain-containing protein [Bacillus nitratireducens]